MALLTQAEVFKPYHHTTDSCWLLIAGKVYDVTLFLEEHPGGAAILRASAGKDATDDFEDAGHNTEARDWMAQYYIGDIDLNN